MITVTRKVHFSSGPRGRRRLIDPPIPSRAISEGRIPRVSRVMALALHFHDLIHSHAFADMTELSRACQVSQPRITQVMSLLHLAPDIQEELLLLPCVTTGRDPIHEKAVRRIAAEVDFAVQRRMWQVLKQTRKKNPTV